MPGYEGHLGLGGDCPEACELHRDRGAWKYGPVDPVTSGGPQIPSERVAEGFRASEIEARLRMEIEPWGVRDRSIGFPCGLIVLAFLLVASSAAALVYVYSRIFDLG